MAINVRDGIPPPPTPINAELKEKLKVVMVKRYIAENKALDLSKFVKDPGMMLKNILPRNVFNFKF